MIPTFQPRRPFHRRNRPESGPSAPPSPPPTPGVMVIQVLRMDGSTLRWIFDSEVTAVGANCPQLLASDGSSGLVSPWAIGQGDANEIDAGYTGVSFPPSTTTWQIAALLDGVTFADGPISVPQSGTADPA